MALIQCHECKKERSSEAKVCPHCGAKAKKEGGGNGWLLGIVGGFVVVLALISSASSPASQEKAGERAAINECWSDYNRKSNTSGDQRFIAGACEMMATKFIAKHGVNP